MFFSTFVLITIYCEHDGLKQRVDFGHRDQPTEVCNMSRLRLEEKKQITVLLRFFVVGKETFLQVCSVFEMIRDLVLLLIYLSPVAIDAHS